MKGNKCGKRRREGFGEEAKVVHSLELETFVPDKVLEADNATGGEVDWYARIGSLVQTAAVNLSQLMTRLRSLCWLVKVEIDGKVWFVEQP